MTAAGERAGGPAGEERVVSAPVCQTGRAELPRKVGTVPGSPLRLRETQRVDRRGAHGAEAASHVVQSHGWGRNPKDGGWLSEAIWHVACRHVASVEVFQAATKVGWDWCDVAHELDRGLLGVDQPPDWHDSHESQ